MAEPDDLDLNKLCEEAEVTQRTVRYYVQQGLLPSPIQAGPATRYGQRHLDREFSKRVFLLGDLLFDLRDPSFDPLALVLRKR